MDGGTLIKLLAISLSAAVLLQQVISALIRAKKVYDGHDEAVSRKHPVAYLFNEKNRGREELAAMNSAKK